MAHLIFVTKYRKQLLVKYGDEMKKIFYELSKNTRDFSRGMNCHTHVIKIIIKQK